MEIHILRTRGRNVYMELEIEFPTLVFTITLLRRIFLKVYRYFFKNLQK